MQAEPRSPAAAPTGDSTVADQDSDVSTAGASALGAEQPSTSAPDTDGADQGLAPNPGFDVEEMEARAVEACQRDYQGFDWQALMETGQRWREHGYPEDQVGFPVCNLCCAKPNDLSLGPEGCVLHVQ